MNIGRYQVLFWPRARVWFKQPIATNAHFSIWKIYQWIVYFWPIEIRKFWP